MQLSQRCLTSVSEEQSVTCRYSMSLAVAGSVNNCAAVLTWLTTIICLTCPPRIVCVVFGFGFVLALVVAFGLGANVSG